MFIRKSGNNIRELYSLLLSSRASEPLSQPLGDEKYFVLTRNNKGFAYSAKLILDCL